MYKTITINNEDYKCVLTAEACCDIEDKLGTNPLNLFTLLDDGRLPKLGDLLTIFHASLQKYNHGIDKKKAFSLYDQYIADGHTLLEFTRELIGIFKESGFVSNIEEVEEDPNA